MQPWAGIVPASGAWPIPINRTDSRAFYVVEERLLRGLARMNILLAACVNDGSIPIFLNTRVGPKCMVCDDASYHTGDRAARYAAIEMAIKCDVGADAIAEALRFYGAASNFQYDRYEYCFPSHEPTESSFMPMHSCSNSNTGHDSWRHLYSSDQFVDWLLAHRLAESDRWWR